MFKVIKRGDVYVIGVLLAGIFVGGLLVFVDWLMVSETSGQAILFSLFMALGLGALTGAMMMDRQIGVARSAMLLVFVTFLACVMTLTHHIFRFESDGIEAVMIAFNLIVFFLGYWALLSKWGQRSATEIVEFRSPP